MHVVDGKKMKTRATYMNKFFCKGYDEPFTSAPLRMQRWDRARLLEVIPSNKAWHSGKAPSHN